LDEKNMKGVIVWLGIIVGVVGLFLVVYSVNIYIPYVGTIQVYPYQVVGAIVLLMGFITLVIGAVVSGDERGPRRSLPAEAGQTELTEFAGDVEKDKRCGACAFFGKTLLCPFKEKNPNARYCVWYKPEKRARVRVVR
jgi:hypothetical protein